MSRAIKEELLAKRQARYAQHGYQSLDPFARKAELEKRLQPVLAREIATCPAGGSAARRILPPQPED